MKKEMSELYPVSFKAVTGTFTQLGEKKVIKSRIHEY